MRVPRLSLPLNATGYELLRGVQWLMLAAIVGSLGTAGFLWWQAHQMELEAIDYEQAARRVEESNRIFVKRAAEAGYDLSDNRVRGLAREVSFANQLLEKGAFSWTRFLGDLEEAIAPRISLGSVKLSFKESVITLTGTALTLKDLTEQIDKLEAHPKFSTVVLSQHQVQDDQASQRQTVNFVMTVVYHPNEPPR